jgi:hypothetical protein
MASLLTIEILAGYSRPVISLNDDVTCLIDTGADIPVWTQGVERLQDLYSTERIEGKRFLLSGFGKGYEIVDAFVIHDLRIVGEGEEVIFSNITLACTERPEMVADLIMPATAFNHMNLMIRTLDVECPIVEIEHNKEAYFINPIYSTVDNSFVERVYSFSNV